MIVVLIQLRKYELHIKLKMCEFLVRQIIYLSFLVSETKVFMNLFKVKTIINWLELRSFWDVQIFIEFCNFYRRFIHAFSLVVIDLTKLLKRSKKRKFTQKFVIVQKARVCFKKLKKTFMSALLLRHFNQLLKTMLEVDVSRIIISSIIS